MYALHLYIYVSGLITVETCVKEKINFEFRDKFSKPIRTLSVMYTSSQAVPRQHLTVFFDSRFGQLARTAKIKAWLNMVQRSSQSGTLE